jgi:cellulose synthase/poly-beta-1,6-N-acetylglucosamine synthase-like glycosyltransferase
VISLLRDGLIGFNYAMLGYFAVLNAIYSLLLVLGWRSIRSYVHRRRLIDYDEIARSPLTIPISMLVPAYNEAPVIVDSVRSLLGAHYPTLEVVVINDGSSDGTVQALIDAFSLVPATRVPVARLDTAEIRTILVSPDDDRLVVIDKANGGKSDAINAGLCYARYPLFCTVDADTLIDDDALLRLVRPFQVQPETIACGGIVRVVNGCTVERSRVVRVQMPRRMIENVQVVEYLRAFLAGRTGWAKLGALLVISGAFGVFRRDLAVEIGGYDTTTVGEDAEFVVRLHRHCRENGIPYRVSFLADPVCWTEVPRTFRGLCRQRNRWHRGLIETLVRHRAMIGRRRYGVVGLFAMPYFVVFEALGPLIETFGYTVAVTSVALGLLDGSVALLLLLLSFSYGLVLSFGALIVEEHAFRRYRSWRCVGQMAVAAVVENFGYRQAGSFVRAWAFVSLIRGPRDRWGQSQRVGFGTPEPAVAATQVNSLVDYSLGLAPGVQSAVAESPG